MNIESGIECMRGGKRLGERWVADTAVVCDSAAKNTSSRVFAHGDVTDTRKAVEFKVSKTIIDGDRRVWNPDA